MLVHLGHVSVAPKIVCERLSAAAILGADFCDQHVRAVRPKRKLPELDNGD